MKQRRARRTGSSALAHNEPSGARAPGGFTAGDEWAKEFDRRGKGLVGKTEWDRFRRSTDLSGCRVLADLANALSRVHTLSRRVATELVERSLDGAPQIVRQVVSACVKHLIDLHLGSVPEVVRAVRALGIFVCVISGRQVTQCPCFRAWWKVEGKQATKSALREALPSQV